jgi:protein TonB
MTAVAELGSPEFADRDRDPLAAVLALGERGLPIGIAMGFLGAVFFHGLVAYKMATTLFEVASFARGVRMAVLERQLAAFDIEVDEAPPPPPSPPAEAEKDVTPEVPVPAPEPAAPDQKVGDPPPAAAEAGKVLTQEPDPDEPVDLTGNGFVTGTGDRYAGGTTAAAGTSKTAVRDPKAKPGGVPGGKGSKPGGAPAAAPPGKDASRPATPTSRSWNCGFPPEADFDQIDYATVMISVTVGADGRAKRVNVLSDPGHGFGRLAKSCAMRMQYNVGADKDGQPLVKTTSPFPVRFTR